MGHSLGEQGQSLSTSRYADPLMRQARSVNCAPNQFEKRQRAHPQQRHSASISVKTAIMTEIGQQNRHSLD